MTQKATLEQIKALASETRLRMFHHLTEGERSEAELAHLLGVKPRSLYHHLRVMAGAGLIKVAGTRQRAKKPEAVYRAVGSLEVDSRQGGPEVRAAFAESVKALLRVAAREFEAAIGDEERVPELSFMTRQRLRLTPERAQEFREELDALVERYAEGSEGEVVCFTAVGAPRVRRG